MISNTPRTTYCVRRQINDFNIIIILLCGSGSNLGPYSATLWIWIQGSLFSHFVDMEPTWVLIQPPCGYGSNLGPYSATLWIWIQLGPVFSHFVDMDPTWVLIQPLCGYGSNLGPYSATLWIWIQLGSVFCNFVDPIPCSAYRSGSRQIKMGKTPFKHFFSL